MVRHLEEELCAAMVLVFLGYFRFFFQFEVNRLFFQMMSSHCLFSDVARKFFSSLMNHSLVVVGTNDKQPACGVCFLASCLTSNLNCPSFSNRVAIIPSGSLVL